MGDTLTIKSFIVVSATEAPECGWAIIEGLCPNDDDNLLDHRVFVTVVPFPLKREDCLSLMYS